MIEPGLAVEGAALVTGLAAVAMVLFLAGILSGRWPAWLAGFAVAVAAVAAAFLYREPVRMGDRGPGLVIAPADGQVVAVEPIPDHTYLGGPGHRVAIRTGLLDAPMVRAPVDGVVDYLDRAADGATVMGISTGGLRVLIRQSSPRGTVRVEEGRLVDQAAATGVLPAGGRVEVLIPSALGVRVRPGQRVRAGATTLAGDA